ncbi:MAG TPA: alpha/beta hydrolase [Jatrophihabitans sp.]|nr:alpha/beta hydrolase [Jatrophihabitans sp.]
MTSGVFLNTEDFASPTLEALAASGDLRAPKLHPSTQSFMRRVARYGGLNDRVSVALARRRMRTLVTLVASKQPVQSIVDRSVSGPGGPIPIRIVTPTTGAAPRPALVWFPGGGFVIGDLATAEPTARGLANKLGAVIVCVDYRKAPEHMLDDGYADAHAVLRWVFANAAGLGIDDTRIGVGGDSAGGNVAAVLAQEYTAVAGVNPLAVQVLVYPAVSVESEPARVRDAYGLLDAEALRWFETHLAGATDPHSQRYYPLLTRNLSGLPPAVIVTAGYDPVRDEGIVYLDRLREAGVRAELLHYADDIHGFFSLDLVLPNAVAALTATADVVADILDLDDATREGTARSGANLLRAAVDRRVRRAQAVVNYGLGQLVHTHLRTQRRLIGLLGLPAGRDVQALNSRIVRLEHQVRALRRQLEHPQEADADSVSA